MNIICERDVQLYIFRTIIKLKRKFLLFWFLKLNKLSK